MMSQRLLKCRVSGGMFSNERVIIVRRKGNGSVEFFVPQESVQGEGEDGRVRVEVLVRPDSTWAVLPTTYRDSIPVDDEELVPS